MLKHGYLEIDKTSVALLRDAQSPTNKKELRWLLVFLNVYWKFIEDLTRLADPLKPPKKGGPYSVTLDIEKKKSVESLVDKICSPPVLTL